MKCFTIPLLMFCYFSVLSQAPENYYSSAEGLSGFQLKTALKTIIDGIDDNNGFSFHQDQGYSALYTAYAANNSGDTDIYYENDGTVLDMYSEKPDGQDPYNYTHFQRQCGNYSSENDCYNREHLVPQSTFNSASPMRNDYFHVVPSDGYVNGARGSYPFGEVTNASYVSDNGSKRGPNTFPGYSGTVFEPIDEFKGDIARSVLYFAIRYEDEFDSSWSSNEVLDNNPYYFFVDWYIELLLSWHINDPVSQREIDRNNNGYQFQGNRNPLIDRPEFAAQIWNNIVDDEDPTAPLNLQADNVTSYSVKLSWQASQDNYAVDSYIIEQDNVNIAQISSEQLSYTVTDLTPETLYNFRVYAVDLNDNVSPPSNNLEVLTLAGSSLLLFDDFENCNSDQSNFISVSEVSSLDWECRSGFGENGSQASVMNAYQGGQVQSLDWLITKQAIDFDIFQVEKLSFWTSAKYGNTKLELLYSSAYDGTGNPSSFQWQEVPNISIPRHPQGDNSLFFYEVNTIDISEISGQVYFAFRYDTTNGDLATQWSVDNFIITGEQLLSNFEFSSNELEVVLYPNPSRDSKIYLDFNTGGLKIIEIYSLTGKRLLTGRTYHKQYIEDLSALSRGNYLIKIKQHGKSVVKKLVLN